MWLTCWLIDGYIDELSVIECVDDRLLCPSPKVGRGWDFGLPSAAALGEGISPELEI